MEHLKKYFEYDDVTEEEMKKIIREQSILDRTDFKNYMVENYQKYV